MSFDAGSLVASLFVSSIGFVAFMYGKRQQRLPHMVIGFVLMAYSYVVPTVPLMLVIGAGLVLLLWLVVRLGM